MTPLCETLLTGQDRCPGKKFYLHVNKNLTICCRRPGKNDLKTENRKDIVLAPVQAQKRGKIRKFGGSNEKKGRGSWPSSRTPSHFSCLRVHPRKQTVARPATSFILIFASSYRCEYRIQQVRLTLRSH